MDVDAQLPPLLPTETRLEILRFCDQGTLAKTCLVSKAFLELSAPLLFDEIVLNGFKAASKFFCRRRQPRLFPELDELLSPRNVRALTFTKIEDGGNSIFLHTDRIPNEVFLPVQLLSLRSYPDSLRSYPEDDEDDVHEGDRRWYPLLDLFEPVVVHVDGSGERGIRASGYTIIDFVMVEWRSLRSITFLNSKHQYPLGDAYLTRGLGERTDPPLVVTFDLRYGFPKDYWPHEIFDKSMMHLACTNEDHDLFDDGSRVEKVVFRVPDEWAREYCENHLVEYWDEHQIEVPGDAERTRRRAFIQFEIEEVDSEEEEEDDSEEEDPQDVD